MSGQYGNNQIHFSDELTQKVVTVGTTQTELFTGGSRNSKRQHVRIYNSGSQRCYIGPTGLTTSTGEPLEKKQWMSMELGDVALYSLTDTSTTTIIVTELA